MIRIENLELEDREEAQRELLDLAAALGAHGAQVEMAGIDESFRGKLEESAGSTAVDVLNIIYEPARDVATGILSAVIWEWARSRRRFRGEMPDDRPQARLWVVEDGREYDYPIDLDPRDDGER